MIRQFCFSPIFLISISKPRHTTPVLQPLMLRLKMRQIQLNVHQVIFCVHYNDAFFSMLVVEVEKFPLMENIMEAYPKHEFERLNSFHMKLFTHMLINRTDRGLLSDAKIVIIIKIDHGRVQFKPITIKGYSISLRSTNF